MFRFIHLLSKATANSEVLVKELHYTQKAITEQNKQLGELVKAMKEHNEISRRALLVSEQAIKTATEGK